MRSIVVFLFIFVTGFPVISQTSVIGSLNELSDQYRVERSRGGIPANSDIEGSPFLNEEFIRGEIVMNDTLFYREIPLRYNMYNDVMEFQNASGQVLELSAGYSHNVFFELPDEIKVETVAERGKNPLITLTSHDKQLLGQVAA